MHQYYRQTKKAKAIAWTALVTVLVATGVEAFGQDLAGSLPTLEQALAAKTDVWGEAAIRQPGGPSYEFFARLLPPLRYVNAEFRHYPIVLSAANSPQKARLISNGSAINARAKLGTWREVGFPVGFYVGENEAQFGQDLERLDGPRYADGYLPIVQMSYREGDATYSEETFAAVEAALAKHAVVFARFAIQQGRQGKVTARVQAKVPLTAVNGALRDEQGRVYVRFGKNWQWDTSKNSLSTSLSSKRPAVLAVFTKPMAELPSADPFSDVTYQRHRKQCVKVWNDLLLKRPTKLEVPEAVVNNAWRSLVVGNFMILDNNKLNYSVDNNYHKVYLSECKVAVGALLRYGFIDEARQMTTAMIDLSPSRWVTKYKYRVSGWKLQLLADYFRITRDAQFVLANRKHWTAWMKLIIEGREPKTGLMPPAPVSGDISTSVYNLHVNSHCWRGLRDMAVVLDELGQPDRELERHAREFRQSIFDAVAKSERRDVDPPFIPNALFGVEKPYETLTASKWGSYWALLSPYFLASQVFDSQPEKAQWVLDYLHQRGGICMGMIRFHQHSGLFANENGVDDNYGFGYVIELLRRDQVDLALVALYGKLAHGLTHDTFIGAEGTSLVSLDKHGRPMYLPPCSAGNGLFLWNLRCLLVQDWDTDDDGKPDTLRLLFATPQRWLRDGAAIKFQEAPTAFGPVSLDVQSRLNRGEVVARVTLPPRRPKQTLLRARVPDGWKVVSASIGHDSLPVDESGAVDLSKKQGKVTVRFKVRKHE